jgi:NAD-dependent deacetylase
MKTQLVINSTGDPAWRTLIERVQSMSRVSVLTGAGISAESGLTTFRGSGLWESFRVEDVATPEAFARNPDLVWRFYNYRRDLVAQAAPNAGHRALVEVQSLRPDAFTLITQNVDGLHQEAGSCDVIELHGSIRRVRCTQCRYMVTSLESLPELPLCECGVLLRPDVVWFGEPLPLQALNAAQKAVEQGGVLLVIGTSAVVYPAAGLIHQARAHGAYIIEVNSAETEATALADAVLRGIAAQMLPRLVAGLAAPV